MSNNRLHHLGPSTPTIQGPAWPSGKVFDPGVMGSSRTGSSWFFVGVPLGKTLHSQAWYWETQERHE